MDLKVMNERMEKTLDALNKNFDGIRAGRANAKVLDRIMVDYYGTPTPINQMAGITVPEPRLLAIQPWDAGALKLIEKAILASDLGVNPVNDGRVIRLAFPQPTEERRKELNKQVHKEGEEAKVAVRNIRRDAMEDLKKEKKDGLITEDEQADLEKDIQKATDKHCKEIDEMVSVKEKEILEI